jgi:Family of unknown function (DUF6279)
VTCTTANQTPVCPPECRPRRARPGPWRRGLAAAAATLGLLLAGCSAVTLAYNQSSVLVYWWLDDLIGFDRSQAQSVKAVLPDLLAWHRRHQLPEWAADLDRLALEVARDATAEQACGWYQRMLGYRDALYGQVAPLVAPIATTFTPAQLQHLERRFRERDDKWRKEHLQPDLKLREEEQLDRTVERLERLYGSIPREQQTWLGVQLRGSPWDAQRWLSERQAQQRITVDSLRQIRSKAPAVPPPGGSEDSLALTRRWLQRISQASSESARLERDRLVRHQCGLSADFHNRTTPAQRQHAAAQLSDWAREARRLMAGGAEHTP